MKHTRCADFTKKNTIMLRDVLIPYHKLFQVSSEFAKHALKNPLAFNITLLTEQTLAQHSRYSRIDADGYDFTDFSECKTSMVSTKSLASCRTSYSVRISNVATPDTGKLKLGALRVLIFNIHLDRVDFFFIPKRDWSKMTTSNAKRNGKCIALVYNSKKRLYSKIEKFRCNTFKELAKKVA